MSMPSKGGDKQPQKGADKSAGSSSAAKILSALQPVTHLVHPQGQRTIVVSEVSPEDAEKKMDTDQYEVVEQQEATAKAFRVDGQFKGVKTLGVGPCIAICAEGTGASEKVIAMFHWDADEASMDAEKALSEVLETAWYELPEADEEEDEDEEEAQESSAASKQPIPLKLVYIGGQRQMNQLSGTEAAAANLVKIAHNIMKHGSTKEKYKDVEFNFCITECRTEYFQVQGQGSMDVFVTPDFKISYVKNDEEEDDEEEEDFIDDEDDIMSMADLDKGKGEEEEEDEDADEQKVGAPSSAQQQQQAVQAIPLPQGTQAIPAIVIKSSAPSMGGSKK